MELMGSATCRAWRRANTWIVDAHRGDGKRFIVRGDEKLTASLELERSSGRIEVRRENFRQTKPQKRIKSSLLRHLYRLSALVVSFSIM